MFYDHLSAHSLFAKLGRWGWFVVGVVTVMDISRPCQPEKLIPLLPWPGFDPSFSGHNDRRAIISEWTWLRRRPLSHRGWRWGWLIRMRLAWKKSQKTLDTSKRLHRNKTWSTGSAGKGTWSQLCHYWDCGLGKVQMHHTWRHLAGCEISWPGGAYNRVLNCGSPSHKVFTVFEPKCINSLLLPSASWYPGHGNRGPTVLYDP